MYLLVESGPTECLARSRELAASSRELGPTECLATAPRGLDTTVSVYTEGLAPREQAPDPREQPTERARAPTDLAPAPGSGDLATGNLATSYTGKATSYEKNESFEISNNNQHTNSMVVDPHPGGYLHQFPTDFAEFFWCHMICQAQPLMYARHMRWSTWW